MRERELFKAILHDLGKTVDDMVKHGAHELSAALFNGSPFVMYHHAEKDNRRVEDPQHGLPDMQREQERGGREIDM